MCMHYGAIILLMFLNSGTSVKDCTGRCVECRKGECQWCTEQWYNHSCEYDCAHCSDGRCKWQAGQCKTSCSPDKCGHGCLCKEEISDANNYRTDISDSIPNNIIVAFVIGIVFIVFIVFIFCGYNKCPEKDDVPRTSRNTARTARRTPSSTTNNSSVMSYPSNNNRSDVTSPLYPYASQNTYRSNMTADAICQPLRTPGRHAAFSCDHPPPPYGSLSPAGIPPLTPEGSAPPTYESLFPAKSLPDPR